MHENRVLTSCGCAGSGRGVMNNVRRDIKCTRMVELINVHEDRVFTGCGCAGSDGQGFMNDMKRDIKCTRMVECI